MTGERIEAQRARHRIENMTEKQIEAKRARDRIENMTKEQLDSSGIVKTLSLWLDLVTAYVDVGGKIPEEGIAPLLLILLFQTKRSWKRKPRYNLGE